MPKRCPQTPDLLSWEPPELVERFEEPVVRSSTLRDRMSRAVAQTLRDSERTREDIAASMAEWLGEDVSKNMLDAYASQARDEHTIPFLRMLALIQVTGDARLLQLGAELFGRAVIDDRYLSWVEVGQLADQKQEIDKAFDSARRQARRRA